jgi:hypothetical protein
MPDHVHVCLSIPPRGPSLTSTPPMWATSRARSPRPVILMPRHPAEVEYLVWGKHCLRKENCGNSQNIVDMGPLVLMKYDADQFRVRPTEYHGKEDESKSLSEDAHCDTSSLIRYVPH